MVNKERVTKKGRIHYKIFKKRDIEKLMNFFINTREELDNEDIMLTITVDYKDQSSAEYNNQFTLDEAKIMESISFFLLNTASNKSMSIYITNTYGSYEIQGKNNDWVDAKFTQLEQILKETPNQNYWLSNFYSQVIISNLLGLIAGFSFHYFFLRKIMNEKILDSNFPYFITIFFTLMIGQYLSTFILKRVLFNSYPEIDFDTTLDHINKNKKRKSFIKHFIIYIVIPLILALFLKLIF